MKSTIAAITTSTPRIVGYQMLAVTKECARFRDTSSPLLQRSLVGHDRFDLRLGEDGAEVGHASRRDAADPVGLVRRDTDADPLQQLVLTGRRRELVVHVTTGEVRAVRAAAHDPGRGVGLRIA